MKIHDNRVTPETGHVLRLGDAIFDGEVIMGSNVSPEDFIEELKELSIEEKIAELEEIVDNKLTIEEKLERINLFDNWEKINNGETLTAGKNVTYKGALYKIRTKHQKQEDWDPISAVSLFVKVEPPKVIEPYTEHRVYQVGDKCTENGKTYESVIPNNVWSPSAYARGWKEV